MPTAFKLLIPTKTGPRSLQPRFQRAKVDSEQVILPFCGIFRSASRALSFQLFPASDHRSAASAVDDHLSFAHNTPQAEKLLSSAGLGKNHTDWRDLEDVTIIPKS